METEGGPNPPVGAPAEPAPAPAPAPKKRWWMVGAGAVATAFLAALGAWLFSIVSPMLEQPFERPLEVLVDDSETECDSYALPASLLEDVPVTALEDDESLQLAEFDGEWIVEHGGLPVAPRRLELTLHGNGDETVVIHSIDVVDFEPLPTADEMIVIYECRPFGGEMVVPSLEANFASQPPVMELSDPELRFPYEVSKDDPEVFDIQVLNPGEPQPCFCRWNIGVSWSAGADLQQMVIEGESLGVSTGISASDWPDHWFVDGEWTTEIPVL